MSTRPAPSSYCERRPFAERRVLLDVALLTAMSVDYQAFRLILEAWIPTSHALMRGIRRLADSLDALSADYEPHRNRFTERYQTRQFPDKAQRPSYDCEWLEASYPQRPSLSNSTYKPVNKRPLSSGGDGRNSTS